MKRKKINYQLLLRRVCLIVLDIVLIIISSLMALLTRFEFDIEQIPEEFLDVLVSYGILMIFVTLSVFAVFRIYSSLWEYAGLEETFKIIGAPFQPRTKHRQPHGQGFHRFRRFL